MTIIGGYTFELNSNVMRGKVKFKNRYGIELVGDLYVPKNKNGKLSALVVSGAFGAVKEQTSGVYANELASHGFVTLAFDNSFTGESGGDVRNVASPDTFTEDFSAAVDYFTTLDYVDENRIGIMAICGLSGMAITAMTVDPRIKAVATASMYDMSNSIGKGFMNSYTLEDKQAILEHVANERTQAAKRGSYIPGPHEIMFDEQHNILPIAGLPNELPEGEVNPILKTFFDYYKTERGYHERSINSTTAWNSTTPYSFFAFPLYTNYELLGDRKILLVAGENAHSLYHSQAVVDLVPQNAELFVVPNADHADLYDKLELIPMDKIVEFFNDNFK